MEKVFQFVTFTAELPVLGVHSRIEAASYGAKSAAAFHGFQSNALPVELERDLVKIRMIHADLCVKIIAVFKAGRIIADFLAFAVAGFQFLFRLPYINVEGNHIPEADDVRIFFFVIIRPFHHEAGRHTVYQFCAKGIALTVRHRGAEAAQRRSVLFPVVKLLLDLMGGGMAAVIKPGRKQLDAVFADFSVFQLFIAEHTHFFAADLTILLLESIKQTHYP